VREITQRKVSPTLSVTTRISAQGKPLEKEGAKRGPRLARIKAAANLRGRASAYPRVTKPHPIDYLAMIPK
jgi:hypothetical protein